MVKILTVNSSSEQDKKLEKENPLRSLWETFRSLDKVTKYLIIIVALVVIVSPFFIQNTQIFNPEAVGGNTLIVGTGGFSNISSAVSAAANGDTISIHTGTYNETVNIDKSLTLQNFGDGQVWIDGGCNNSNGIYVTSSGVTIKGIGVKRSDEAGIKIETANDVTVDNVIVQDYNCADIDDQYRAGIASWGGGMRLKVLNSVITRRADIPGNLPGGGNGIWVKNTALFAGGSHHFANNTITGGYDGIGGEPEDVAYGSFNKDTIIENNTISDCADDGIQTEGGNQNNIVRYNSIKRCLIGIAFTPALTGPLTIFRNVISEPIERFGLGAAMFKMGDGSVGEVRVYHNSFFAGSEVADGAKQTNGGGLSNVNFRNNAIYASRYVIETGEAPTGTANYDALRTSDTTRFVKWAGSTYGSITDFSSSTNQEKNGISTSNFGWDSNFRLQTGSPLIDKGVVLPGYNDNFSGSAPDIGAFEFAVTVIPSPTTGFPTLTSVPTAIPTPTKAPTPTPTRVPTPTPTPIPSVVPSSGPTPTQTPIDNIKPTIVITYPINGSSIQRGKRITIIASASDNIGIKKVEFYINGRLKCTDLISSYSCQWKVPRQSDVTYTINVIAYDTSGNQSSAQSTVTSTRARYLFF
ncbi:MAG: right-handed parallel beta-helix repeat-containing protein [Candidatus Levybacteria bacterium]|nr:right-handed parallel beta-helix repeat-containing protein [Candidatus Levybacteria bacterium]